MPADRPHITSASPLAYGLISNTQQRASPSPASWLLFANGHDQEKDEDEARRSRRVRHANQAAARGAAAGALTQSPIAWSMMASARSISSAFTVRGGASDGGRTTKFSFAETFARRWRIPFVRLVDGTGGGGSVKNLETQGYMPLPDVPQFSEVLAALSEDAGLDQLLDRRQQRRRWTPEHRRQIGDGERSPERSRHRCDLTRCIRHTGQTLSHARAESVGKPVVDQTRTSGFHSDKPLLAQALEQFDEQERVAAGLVGHQEQALIGFGPHHVARHLGHGGLAQRLEDEPFRALVGPENT